MACVGSPAQLSLTQAAEAELAKVEQDHAPEQPLSGPPSLVS